MLTHESSQIGVNDVYRNDISISRDKDFQRNKTDQRQFYEKEPSKMQQSCKKAAKFLFSHIGLVGLVVVYAVAGGFLFELLEQHQEKLNCQEAHGEEDVELTKLKQNLITYIQYNTTSSLSTTTLTYSTQKDNATVAYAKIASMLYDYRDFVISTSSKYRYFGDDCSIINKWTFPNSLLFAITIITTIGYGNITPVTWEGQICCICYATIGIPIFLLCVANISGVLGEMFRFIYSKVLCRPCHLFKKRRAMARKAKLEEDSGMQNGRMNTDAWSIDDNKNEKSIKKNSNKIFDESDLDEEFHRRNQRVTVPLTITMLIIAAYIWLGSLIFHTFEQWTLTQAGYFCFITLATIGFGDFVPGQRKDDPNAGAKLILGAIYVLFGMAILAMCFDLMQEEIVAKFRWLGRKIGIVEKLEDPIDNQDNKPIHNDNRHLSRTSSINEPNSITNKSDHMIDDSSRHSANGSRKFSPRHNNTRVHPMMTNSDEGTLHQRTNGTNIN